MKLLLPRDRAAIVNRSKTGRTGTTIRRCRSSLIRSVINAMPRSVLRAWFINQTDISRYSCKPKLRQLYSCSSSRKCSRRAHHVIDIVPTILEATGIKAPDEVNRIKQKPMEGLSMVYTFDKSNADVPTKHDTQYFEMVGNRAIYHDGWVAATTPPVAPWLLGAKM